MGCLIPPQFGCSEATYSASIDLIGDTSDDGACVWDGAVCDVFWRVAQIDDCDFGSLVLKIWEQNCDHDFGLWGAQHYGHSIAWVSATMTADTEAVSGAEERSV